MSEQKCRKVYVPVNLDVDAEGNIRPRLIRWVDGRVYEIDRLKHKCRAASTKVGGCGIRYTVMIGGHQPNNPKLVYTMDFQVTPHQLRHTYITNLIYASVDPKTVQYLAGHENSKVTMDIYAKVKYNKPAQLHGVINRAIDTSKKD